MAEVRIAAGTFVNLYTATGITPGAQLRATNKQPNDVRLYSTGEQPNETVNDWLPLLFRHVPAVTAVGAAGAWAYAVADAAIDVVAV